MIKYILKFFKKLFLTFFIFLFTFVFSGFSVVLADTDSGTVSINANYAGGEATPPIIILPPEEPPDTSPPIISSVSVAALTTSALVSWNAIDNVGVLYCDFQYGESLGYGFTKTVLKNGDIYSSSLSALNAGTLYYIKITCGDLAGNVSS